MLGVGAMLLAWMDEVSALTSYFKIYSPDWHPSCNSALPIVSPVTSPWCGTYSRVDITYSDWSAVCNVSHSSWLVNWHYSWTWTANLYSNPWSITNISNNHSSHGSHWSHWSHWSY